MLLPVSLDFVRVLFNPLAVLEEGRIHIFRSIKSLLLEICLRIRILGFQGFVRYGIQQTASIDSYSGLKAYAHLIHWQIHGLAVSAGLNRYIICVRRYGHFRIDEAVCLSVRETISPFVSVIEPVYLYFLFIQRSFERSYGLSLRHSGEGCQIGSGLFVINEMRITCSYIYMMRKHAISTNIYFTIIFLGTQLCVMSKRTSISYRYRYIVSF